MGRKDRRLTRERIIGVAIRLVDENGMEALSMRRLAVELGVDPMAIYYHVPGKKALLSEMVGVVFAEMRTPLARDRGWREQIREWTLSYRDLIRAHPDLILYLISDAEAGAAALAVNELLFDALSASKLPASMIVRAADLIVDYVHGFAIAEVGGPLGQPDDRRKLLERLRSQPAEAFPNMRRVFEDLSGSELRADFEFGLDVILDGLETLAQRRGSGNDTTMERG